MIIIMRRDRKNCDGRLCGVYKIASLQMFGVGRLNLITHTYLSYEYVLCDVVCCSSL